MTLEPTLWTSMEAARATGGTATSQWLATGVSINTRTLQSGDLFFSLSGPTFDGHDFAPYALDQGGAAVVVSRALGGDDNHPSQLIVDDTLIALEDLGRAARARMNGQVIAVTGSVGKTSTKEMLRLVLSDQGNVSASYGNLNNHWGLPLSLSRMPAETDFGLFELGMNSPGEIRPLSEMTRPNVAIITTVEPVHAAFFSSVEEIADAKAEIFEGVVDGGYALINCDNPHYDRLRDSALRSGNVEVLGFGHGNDAWAHIIDAALHSEFSDVTATIDGTHYQYRIGAPGKHLVMNSVAVLAAVALVGGDVSASAVCLASYQPLTGRGDRCVVEAPFGEFVLVNESYNASPVSMRAALDVAGRMHPSNGGRRIVVIGDMLELGDSARNEHMALVEPLQSNGVDLVFTSGQYTQELWAQLPKTMRGGHSESPDKLSMVVSSAVGPGDIVMVKGSLGSKVGVIVDALLALDPSFSTAREK